MCDAYVFQAALLCEHCGKKQIESLAAIGITEAFAGDSDVIPDGPYSDGGGEADSPQHCDYCRAFLRNPLTGDGESYVKEAVAANTGNPEVLADWREYYSYLF